MPKVSLALCAILFTLCAAAAFAQTYTVEFVSGPVDIRTGSSWKAVDFDEKLGGDALLRLGPGGLVELAGSGGRVSAAKPGSYKVGDLFAAGAASRGSVMKGATSKLTKLATSSQSTATAVAGVRGDLATNATGDILWASEDDPDSLMLLADKAVAEGRPEDAAVDYEKAYLAGGNPLAFKGQVWALAAAGKTASALAALAAENSQDEELLLLRARLLIDASAPEEAELILMHLEKSPEPPIRQEAVLLLGYAALSRLDTGLAISRFKEARNLDPASELGLEAASCLAEVDPPK